MINLQLNNIAFYLNISYLVRKCNIGTSAILIGSYYAALYVHKFVYMPRRVVEFLGGPDWCAGLAFRTTFLNLKNKDILTVNKWQVIQSMKSYTPFKSIHIYLCVKCAVYMFQFWVVLHVQRLLSDRTERHLDIFL